MRYDGVARNLEQLMAAAAERAAHALSRLVNEEVRVSCCELYHSDWRDALTESLQGRGALVTVSQTAFGARVYLVHVNVPAHDYKGVTAGWPKFYWKPWRAYLAAKS